MSAESPDAKFMGSKDYLPASMGQKKLHNCSHTPNFSQQHLCNCFFGCFSLLLEELPASVQSMLWFRILQKKISKRKRGKSPFIPCPNSLFPLPCPLHPNCLLGIYISHTRRGSYKSTFHRKPAWNWPAFWASSWRSLAPISEEVKQWFEKTNLDLEPCAALLEQRNASPSTPHDLLIPYQGGSVQGENRCLKNSFFLKGVTLNPCICHILYMTFGKRLQFLENMLSHTQGWDIHNILPRPVKTNKVSEPLQYCINSGHLSGPPHYIPMEETTGLLQLLTRKAGWLHAYSFL